MLSPHPFLVLRVLQAVDLAADVESVAEAAGLKTKPLKAAIRTLLILLRGAVKYAVSPAGVKEDFLKLGELRGRALMFACCDIANADPF